MGRHTWTVVWAEHSCHTSDKDTYNSWKWRCASHHSRLVWRRDSLLASARSVTQALGKLASRYTEAIPPVYHGWLRGKQVRQLRRNVANDGEDGEPRCNRDRLQGRSGIAFTIVCGVGLEWYGRWCGFSAKEVGMAGQIAQLIDNVTSCVPLGIPPHILGRTVRTWAALKVKLFDAVAEVVCRPSGDGG